MRATRVEQSDLEHAADVIEVAAAEAEAADNRPVERAALEVLIRLRSRLGADNASVDDLRERIARSHVREAEARESESPQLSSHSYGEALAIYLQLGSARFGAEIEQLEQRIKEQNLHAHEAATRFEHEFTIDMSPIHEFADSLVGRDGLEDLHVLANVDGLLPSVGEVREQTAAQRENDPLLFFVPRSIFRGGNQVDVAQSDEEIFESVLAENYGHSLGITVREIEIVVEKLSEVGQWQEDRVMAVLRRADLLENCDLRLLEHALGRYFAGDHVSATPLLALQVEPILRCVLERLGLATSRTDRRSGVTREKNLEEILATRELADLLPARTTSTSLGLYCSVHTGRGFAMGPRTVSCRSTPSERILPICLSTCCFGWRGFGTRHHPIRHPVAWSKSRSTGKRGLKSEPPGLPRAHAFSCHDERVATSD